VFSMGKLGILWELDRTTGRFVRAPIWATRRCVDVDPKTARRANRPGMLQELGREFYMCPTTGGFKNLEPWRTPRRQGRWSCR